MRPMPSLAVISTKAWHISRAWARDSSAHGPAMSTSGRSLAMARLPMVTVRGAVGGMAFMAAFIAEDSGLACPLRPHQAGRSHVFDEGLPSHCLFPLAPRRGERVGVRGV